jgi:acyl-CoA reductase-like NAD-dependent aldehyde dehydrogenase
MTTIGFEMLVDGEMTPGDLTLDVINPATEELVAQAPHASERQLEQAVAAARRAFRGWAARPLAERQAAVAAMADAIESNADDLARLLTQEQGKPLAEAQGEVGWSVGYLRHYATLSPPTRVIQDDEGGLIELRRRPLGVVVGIVAWNFPLLLGCWKVGPAVLAGNTIVLKPAPTTPLTTLALGRLIRGIFPAGVVNIITDANELGPLLTGHPDVAKVSFTGSAATGSAIMRNAASAMKRVTLELGGNDPAIVLEDVDVRETARKIFDAAFLNCGQVCLAVKRVYVHEGIYDTMCEELARLADEAVVDDGSKQGTRIGPLQNRAQFEKIKAFIEKSRTAGTIVAGGEVLDRKGFFVRPTIVRDLPEGSALIDEEQFGPILPVMSFADVDEAIERANSGSYGLGGSVWSQDIDRALDIADRIESGSVWVNQHLGIGPHIPMAGAKSSGIGVEQSDEGLAEYTQPYVVNVAR